LNSLILKFWSLETNHKFWVDLEIIMLSLLKISPRPTWSVFIITQNLKIILMSNQSHWKANTIIQNFHVYTESQFKTKMCEKDTRIRNRDAVTMKLASRASHSPWRVMTGCCREKPIFYPKIPILNPLSLNLIPNFVQTFINTKRDSKPYKTWTKTSF